MPNGSLCCLPGDPASCAALGLFWDAGGQLCRDLFGGAGAGCPDPPPTFYCGQIMPELGGECMVYYLTTGNCFSPILLDVDGDGFALTDAAGWLTLEISRSKKKGGPSSYDCPPFSCALG